MAEVLEKVCPEIIKSAVREMQDTDMYAIYKATCQNPNTAFLYRSQAKGDYKTRLWNLDVYFAGLTGLDVPEYMMPPAEKKSKAKKEADDEKVTE